MAIINAFNLASAAVGTIEWIFMEILQTGAEVPVTLAVKCVRHRRTIFICIRNGALISVKFPSKTKQMRPAMV